jgi:AraC-like DNA-binding protein
MILDATIGSAAVAILGLLALLAWRRGGSFQRVRAACWVCVGAYVLHSTDALAALLGPFRIAVVCVAALTPYFFFVAARQAFTEYRSLPTNVAIPGMVGLMGLAIAPELLQDSMSAAVVEAASNAASLALFAAALYEAWSGLKDDLDPIRRSRRLQLLGLALFFGLTIAVLALFGPSNPTLPWTRTLIPAAILLIAMLYAVESFVLLEEERPASNTVPKPDLPTPPADEILISHIRSAFSEGMIHRRDDLSLSALSQHLGVPEHQVRRAINQGLGYKNFSTFVNEHRLDEVKKALTDPAQAEVPISTIALDAGFGSLATFNRVFKDVTGQAPSDFRRRLRDGA